MTKSFDDYYNEAQEAAQPHPAHSAWVGFTTGVDDTAMGFLQTAGQALGMHGFLAGLDRYRKKKYAEYEMHAKANPWSTKGAYAGGLVTGSAPMGIVAASNPASAGAAIGRGAGAGLMFGLGSYGTPGERLQSGALGATLGAAIPAAARGVSQGVSALRGLGNQSMRNQVVGDIAGNLKSTGQVGAALQNVDKAAKMGVHLNPAQAAGHKVMGNITARIPKDVQSQQRVARVLSGEEKMGKGFLSKLKSDLVPEGYEQSKAAYHNLYEKVKHEPYSKQLADYIKNNETAAAHLQKLRGAKSADWGMKKVAPGSYDEAHKLAQELRASATEQGSASGNLKSVAKDIMGMLDENPDFKKANTLFSQVSSYDEITKGLKKIQLKPGQNIADGDFDAMYKKLFGTKELQDNYIEVISRVGGDAEHSRNVLQLLNNMRGNPIGRVVGKKADDVIVDEVPGIGARALNMFTRFKQGRYNKQILDVYMDPKWKSKVEAVLQNKDPVKQASGMLDLLETSGAVSSAVGAAAANNEEMMKGAPMAQLPGAPKKMAAAEQSAPSAPGQSDFQKAMSGESYIHPAKKDAEITHLPKEQSQLRLSQDFDASYPQQAIQKTMASRGVNMEHPAVQLANRIPVPNPQDYDSDNQYIQAVNDYYNDYTSVAYEIYDAPHVPLNPENRL